MAAKFETVQTSDLVSQTIQDNVAKVLNPLLMQQITDRGVLIKSVVLTAGVDNLVNHGLNRSPLMWIVARQDTNANVWEAVSPLEKQQLNIWCSSNCTVNLWVA